MTRLLLVEDDLRIASFIQRGLVAEGHVLDVARSGVEAMPLLRETEYPLVILDRMLPDMDGVEICRQIRSENISSRVLMLTARDAVTDKVGGLNAGADS